MGWATLLDGIENIQKQRSQSIAPSSCLEYGVFCQRRGEFLLGKGPLKEGYSFIWG
jgi:hypothetical protein